MELPEGFEAHLRKFDPPWLDTLIGALCGEPTVALRINRRKAVAGERPLEGRIVPWCEYGYLLPERPQFIFDPALHQGI